MAPSHVAHFARGSTLVAVVLGLTASSCAAPPIQKKIEARRSEDLIAGQRAFEKGQERAQTGDHAAAVPWFEEAVARDPSLGVAYLELAESHRYLDADMRVVRRDLERALPLLPGSPRLHCRYASTLSTLGESDAAEEHWQRALALRPDLLEARLEFAASLEHRGEIDSARAELEKALAVSPEHVQARIRLADILEQERLAGDAARHVETAAKVAARSAPLYRRAAKLYEIAGDPGAAVRLRAAADALDPPRTARALRPLPRARRIR